MTCCFIGHRKINDIKLLRENLRNIVINLINNGTENFIFGDRSAFNSLCYETVTELKKEYPEIKRIHFRKDYEDTNDYTMQLLIIGFDKSICPKGVGSAGKASYIERNKAMIKESDICVFYYDEKYSPSGRKSGTRLAYNFALKNNKEIINCYTL